jgi:aminobenzoyl-glutamate transport protein
MFMDPKAAKKSFFFRILDWIELVGNLLPHPAMLFALFAVCVVFASGMAAAFGLSAVHPGTGESVEPVNLLSGDGLRYIMTSLVRNFTGFAPLGTVLVALLGIGIAEGSGFIGSVLRLLVTSAPPRLLTGVIVFCGVISNMASEVGYVLLVPLAGIIFLAVGRHPLAGMAAAFAGVSGGYSANVALGTVDPLLAGISQEAARIIDPEYVVNPACNYYFMFVSTFVLTIVGTLISEKIVEPRLGKYDGDEKPMTIEKLSVQEKRGLRFAVIAGVVIIILLVLSALPGGALRDPKTDGFLHSPFMSGIVAIVFFGAGIMGVSYGIGAGTIRKNDDVAVSMGKAMSTLGSYIALVFFAAQFVAYFNESRLGLILAVKGAEVIKAIGLPPIPLFLLFILVSASINMMMGSASAKWAIMAPVFVPMFMLLGYTPEVTQAAYRVGDSSTNIISPMMSYFALIVAYVQRYAKHAGLGTVISTMMPFTIGFLVVWSLLFTLFMALDIPVGPGAQLHLSK